MEKVYLNHIDNIVGGEKKKIYQNIQKQFAFYIIPTYTFDVKT